MKRYVVFFVLFNSFVLHGMALWDSCQAVELHKAYNRLKSDTTQKAQEDFFWAFPRNWNEYLIMEYEVSNRYEEDISNYIEAFGELTAINDTLYCAKLIAVVRGAYLDADGPNYLHGLLHGVMGDSSQVSSYYTPHGKENMPFIMLWLLSRELKGDIMRFWQFYWLMLYFEEDGGVHNDYSFNDDFYRLRGIVEKEYPDMVEPMTIAYRYFHHGVIFLSDNSFMLRPNK